MTPLFALDFAGWLSPDLILKLGGGLLSGTAVASAVWYIAGRGYRTKVRNLKDKAEHYQEVHAQASSDLAREQAVATELRQDYAKASAQLTELTGKFTSILRIGHQWRERATLFQTELNKYRVAFAKLKKEYEALLASKSGLEAQVSTLSDDGAVKQAVIERTERRMRRALKLEGQLWAAKALLSRPRFRELAQRRRAVIAVLNLKGGVGKTTVTAHLGAALAQRGYRVLVVDLDLQGSLTGMLLPQDKINQLFAGKLLMQHFLSRSAEDKTTKITEFAQRVFDIPESGGSLSVVGTTDALAYAELNLTMQWLLHSGQRDTRFLLRKALHLMGVGKEYDIVLLDCPPVVNISCVNALAASDFLLIPTTLSAVSLARVPQLVKRLFRSEKFLKHINHDLRILGLVANRTWRDDLAGGEKDDWDQLATKCNDIYGQVVKRFDTIIPQQTTEVRDSEIDFGPPQSKSRLAVTFAALATEIEKELPSECRRIATASQ
jgi:cellulose biosynthesis protein BcsQ